MKYFTFFIGLMMLGFAAAAQTTTRPRPPIKTSGMAPTPVRVVQVVPLKTSGGAKMVSTAAVKGAGATGGSETTGTGASGGAAGGAGTNGAAAKTQVRPSQSAAGQSVTGVY